MEECFPVMRYTWFSPDIQSDIEVVFLCVCRTSLLKDCMGKGEIARDEHFSHFPQCFLAFWRTFHHFPGSGIIWNAGQNTEYTYKIRNTCVIHVTDEYSINP